MRKRRELVAARIALTALDKSLPRCAITGEIAFDAVRTTDGRIVNEKDLVVHEDQVSYNVDRDIRTKCRTAIERVHPAQRSTEEIRLERDRVNWKNMIHRGGMQSFVPFSHHPPPP